eukprot:Clim_evm22s4 gene=Clim_evmTU22s4
MAEAYAPASPPPSSPNRKRRRPDFEFGDVLGEGSYSEVKECKEISSGRKFAVKIVNKSLVIREKKIKYVTIERDVFAKIGAHPFFVRLYFTFQDESRLFFVLSLAPKGELLDWILKMGCFELSVAQWYAAEIVEALEHLYRVGIIHRDLKPENILVSEQRHIRITDFGTAKILSGDPEKDRSNSFVGTAEYGSPELIGGKETVHESDLWAFACILFQMIAGKPPFTAGHAYGVFKKVEALEYEFPNGFPENAQDLISKILIKDPAKRLGSEREGGGFAALKAHPFFNGIQWGALHRTEPPEMRPYLPPVSGEDAQKSDLHLDRIEQDHMDDKDAPEEIIFGAGGTAITSIKDDIEIGKGSIIRGEERKQILKEQESLPIAPIIPSGEVVLHHGPMQKRRGLFGNKRYFILTDAPRFMYCDPSTFKTLGEIDIGKHTKYETKGKWIIVHNPSASIFLKPLEGSTEDWIAPLEESTRLAFSGAASHAN